MAISADLGAHLESVVNELVGTGRYNSKSEVLREHGGAQFSAFKPALIDLAVAKLSPIAESAAA